jgi:molybdopterin molybdotransferase
MIYDGGNPLLVLSLEDARDLVEEHASKLCPRPHGNFRFTGMRWTCARRASHRRPRHSSLPRSTRDGYAVRSADLAKLPSQADRHGRDQSRTCSQRTKFRLHYSSGETFSIMTGAPVPQGADAVVMIEYTSAAERVRRNHKGRCTWRKHRRSGSRGPRGSLLLKRARLNEAAIALAASVGKSRLQRLSRPASPSWPQAMRSSTLDGNESPVLTQIRNSNSYSLAVQIQQAGGDPVLLPIAPDEPAASAN